MLNSIVSVPETLVSETPDHVQQESPQRSFVDEWESYAVAAWEAVHPYETPENGYLPALGYSSQYDPNWGDGLEF
jgi:hypothetical protein